MSRKKPDGKPTRTRAVKVDRAIADKAEMIARDKGVDLAAYISEALRSVVSRDWAKLVRRIEESKE